VEIALLAAYVAFLNFLPKVIELQKAVDTGKLAKPAELHNLTSRARKSRWWIRTAIFLLTTSLVAEILFIMLARATIPWCVVLNVLWYIGPIALLVSGGITFFSLWPWWNLYLYLLDR
jgi:hypothetical protein